MGRRVWTASDGVTNYFVYDGAQVVADVDASGTLIRSYAWGPGIDNLLAMTIYGGPGAPRTVYAIKDHLGSIHAMVDAGGNVVEQYRYDAWGRTTVYDGAGKPLTQSAIGNRHGWQGREISWATGLYYFRARWYDPVTGRWLSNDPIGISGGLNQYVFCANNPVNFRDPNGLDYRFIVEGPVPGVGHTIVEIRRGDGSTHAYDVQGWDPDLNGAELAVNTLFLRRTQGTVERRYGPFDSIFHHPGKWQKTCDADDQRLVGTFEGLANLGVGGVGYNLIYANSMTIPRAIVENTLHPPDRSGEMIFELGSSPFSK